MSLVRWFVTELGGGQDASALDAQAAAVPPGSDGVVALGTWQGSRTPHRDPGRRDPGRRDPGRRGAFTGLALGHGRAHLYRAILKSAASMSRVAGCAEPDPGRQAAYESGFRSYQDIAAALASSG